MLLGAFFRAEPVSVEEWQPVHWESTELSSAYVGAEVQSDVPDEVVVPDESVAPEQAGRERTVSNRANEAYFDMGKLRV